MTTLKPTFLLKTFILFTTLQNIHAVEDGYLRYVKDSCFLRGEALSCVKYKAVKIAKKAIFGDNLNNNETIKANKMISLVPLDNETIEKLGIKENEVKVPTSEPRGFLSEWAELAKYFMKLFQEFFKVKGIKVNLPEGARTVEEEEDDGDNETKDGEINLTKSVQKRDVDYSKSARGKKKKLALIIPLLTLLAVLKMKLLLIPILLSVLLLKKLALIAALLLPSVFSTLKACKLNFHHRQGIGKIFFLDAPGGTGKTFLINLLLAKVRRNRGIALAVASSGIAATLLEGGKTAHAAFKLPLNLIHIETPLCNISKQSNTAQVLRDCKLIVWDERTMAHKGGFEALNRTLKDIRGIDDMMGGITVLLAGDFRQTLPVVPRGTRADEVKACIKASNLWPLIKKLHLKKNMRVHLKGDVYAGQFSDLLLKIGNGEYTEIEGKIIIPSDLALVVSTVDDLIARIYPDVQNLHSKSMDWLCERAILTPKNDQASVINDTLLKSFEGAEYEYKSVDTVVHTDDAVHYPAEFLNALNPPGLPSHKFILKVGAPIMLLRNLNPPKLCNGTRLRVKALHKNVVKAIIFTGCARGESVYIPRIPLIPSEYPFEFKRLQFPVKDLLSSSNHISIRAPHLGYTIIISVRRHCLPGITHRHQHHPMSYSYFGSSDTSDYAADYNNNYAYSASGGYGKDWASNRAYNMMKHRSTPSPAYITAPGVLA